MLLIVFQVIFTLANVRCCGVVGSYKIHEKMPICYKNLNLHIWTVTVNNYIVRSYRDVIIVANIVTKKTSNP